MDKMKINRPVYYDLKSENELPKWLEFDIVELKYDGIWGRMEIDNGNLQIYSRNDKLKYECEVDHKGRLTLLGEFMYGSNWAETMGVKGQFFAFDILLSGSDDLKPLPLTQRKEILQKVVETLPEWIKPVKYYTVDKWKEIWEDDVCDKYWEGLIFKGGETKYGEPWGRMKRNFTVDYVVMGFNKSNAESFKDGAASSIQGGLYENGELKTICNVSGLSDYMKYELWDNQEKYIGKVFEATGKGIFPSGCLRHPSFVMWREDKQPNECSKNISL